MSNDLFGDEAQFRNFISWVSEEFKEDKINPNDISSITNLRNVADPRRSFKRRRKTGTKPLLVQPAPVPLKWFVFRGFSRSDALRHFPKTFARLSNSGEGAVLGKLISAYCKKDCKIFLARGVIITLAQFVQMLEFNDLLFPDSITVMHTTAIVGNQINALFYFKYTDAYDLHTFADVIVRDPFLKLLYVGDRRSLVPRMLNLQSAPPNTQCAVNMCLARGIDIQIYGQVNWKITFDPHSKKFVEFEHFWFYTEVVCAGERYKLF